MPVKRPLADRVADMVAMTDTGCLVWLGHTHANGYGRIRVGYGADRVMQPAHRAVYEMCVGPIPPGLDLDHLCRVRHCVNPDHLEPVTRGENVQRGFAARGYDETCGRGHPRTEKGIKSNCRACDREKKRAARLALGKTPRPYRHKQGAVA